MFVRCMTMVLFLFCCGGYVAIKVNAQWKIGSVQLDQLGWKPTTTCENIPVRWCYRDDICTHKPTLLRNLGVTTWFILREHANVVTQLGITTWLIMCAYTNVNTQLGVNTWKKILNYTGTERLRGSTMLTSASC